jgi:hypothetical protein
MAGSGSDRLPSAPLYLSLTGIGPDCFRLE